MRTERITFLKENNINTKELAALSNR